MTPRCAWCRALVRPVAEEGDFQRFWVGEVLGLDVQVTCRCLRCDAYRGVVWIDEPEVAS